MEEFMTLNEFCQIYKKEIDEAIKKQEAKQSKGISRQEVIKNAISDGITIEQMDRDPNILFNERDIEGVVNDE